MAALINNVSCLRCAYVTGISDNDWQRLFINMSEPVATLAYLKPWYAP
jgi:hypothetical protein